MTLFIGVFVAGNPPKATAQTAPDFPRFRQALLEQQQGSAPPAAVIRLLAEPDYAPWSFTLDDGTMAGISVDLALVACEQAGLSCEVIPVPFTQLVSMLAANQGDVIISGLKINRQIETDLLMSRPYFRSLGQFAIRSGSSIVGADPESLSGKKIGYVKDTLHGAFLQSHYSRSERVPSDNEARLFEDLRTGVLDAVFADSVRLLFWMKGERSKNCCERLGGAMIDSETVSRPLVFVVRPDSAALRDRLDAALDQLEEEGRTGAVFQRYLPGKIW